MDGYLCKLLHFVGRHQYFCFCRLWCRFQHKSKICESIETEKAKSLFVLQLLVRRKFQGRFREAQNHYVRYKKIEWVLTNWLQNYMVKTHRKKLLRKLESYSTNKYIEFLSILSKKGMLYGFYILYRTVNMAFTSQFVVKYRWFFTLFSCQFFGLEIGHKSWSSDTFHDILKRKHSVSRNLFRFADRKPYFRNLLIFSCVSEFPAFFFPALAPQDLEKDRAVKQNTNQPIIIRR